MEWDITGSELDVVQRHPYYIEQPMCFNCDQELRYEGCTRNQSTQTFWCNLDMVDDTLFEIRIWLKKDY